MESIRRWISSGSFAPFSAAFCACSNCGSNTSFSCRSCSFLAFASASLWAFPKSWFTFSSSLSFSLICLFKFFSVSLSTFRNCSRISRPSSRFPSKPFFSINIHCCPNWSSVEYLTCSVYWRILLNSSLYALSRPPASNFNFSWITL